MGKNNNYTASPKKEVRIHYTYNSKKAPCHNSIALFLVPPRPLNVVIVRFDPTSIGVSWTKFTLVELKGLANYTVTYDIVIDSRKRQLGGMITVPWTQNQVILSNLQSGAEYQVNVRTLTTRGTSGTL